MIAAFNRLQQYWYTITIVLFSIWIGEMAQKQFHEATESFNDRREERQRE